MRMNNGQFETLHWTTRSYQIQVYNKLLNNGEEQHIDLQGEIMGAVRVDVRRIYQSFIVQQEWKMMMLSVVLSIGFG